MGVIMQSLRQLLEKYNIGFPMKYFANSNIHELKTSPLARVFYGEYKAMTTLGMVANRHVVDDFAKLKFVSKRCYSKSCIVEFEGHKADSPATAIYWADLFIAKWAWHYSSPRQVGPLYLTQSERIDMSFAVLFDVNRFVIELKRGKYLRDLTRFGQVDERWYEGEMPEHDRRLMDLMRFASELKQFIKPPAVLEGWIYKEEKPYLESHHIVIFDLDAVEATPLQYYI